MSYEYSEAGVALTEQCEGRRLMPYRDGGGVLTAGYGHTGPDVVAGVPWTAAQADHALRADITHAVNYVNTVVTSAINQTQFDAMVDFCFNVGTGSFRGSTLLHLVNVGDFAGAAEQFGLWVKVNGKPERGLVTRRALERALFLS